MFGKIGWACFATLMAVSGVASAGETTNSAALTDGKPAGVEKAYSFQASNSGLMLVGAAGIVGGIVLVATGDSHGAVNGSCTLAGCVSTTTTTSPSTTTTTTKPSTTTTTTKPTTTTTTTKTTTTTTTTKTK